MSTYVDEEYEIQHFGFSSTYFIQEFYALQCNLTKTTMEMVKSCLPNEITDEEKTVHCTQIEKLNSETEKLLKKAAHDLRVKFKVKPSIHGFFAIPKTVVLETDKYAANLQDSKQAIRNLEEETIQLEKQYVKKRTFHYLSEKEIEILESLEPIKRQVKEIMKKSQALCTTNKSDEIQKLTLVYKQLTNQMANQFKYLNFEDK